MSKYLSAFKTGFLESIAYKQEVFFNALATLVFVGAFYFLWQALYEVIEIPGFGFEQLMWYFLFAQGIRFAARSPARDVTQLIQRGDVINFLNKPLNLFFYQLFVSLGKTFLNAIMILLIGGLLLSLFVSMPTITLLSIPFIVFIIFLGVVLNFIISFGIALSAFWLEDARPLEWIYDKVIFILGGLLFPLELLPGLLQTIASWLPTAYFVYAPAKLAANFSTTEFLNVLFMQGFFITICGVIVFVLTTVAYKHVSINGG